MNRQSTQLFYLSLGGGGKGRVVETTVHVRPFPEGGGGVSTGSRVDYLCPPTPVGVSESPPPIRVKVGPTPTRPTPKCKSRLPTPVPAQGSTWSQTVLLWQVGPTKSQYGDRLAPRTDPSQPTLKLSAYFRIPCVSFVPRSLPSTLGGTPLSFPVLIP